ncbi:hypothetical protein SDC9_137496 [bioreactor metagenome]|uniref:Uncharacterized protein n=1 Tax=bioreactor metagenome TaxID=1076179 RepID=A0A645DM95_9ZZZZ
MLTNTPIIPITNNAITPGNNFAKDLDTAGGTPSGILIVNQDTLDNLTYNSVETIATIIAVNNALVEIYPQGMNPQPTIASVAPSGVIDAT